MTTFGFLEREGTGILCISLKKNATNRHICAYNTSVAGKLSEFSVFFRWAHDNFMCKRLVCGLVHIGLLMCSN